MPEFHPARTPHFNALVRADGYLLQLQSMTTIPQARPWIEKGRRLVHYTCKAIIRLCRKQGPPPSVHCNQDPFHSTIGNTAGSYLAATSHPRPLHAIRRHPRHVDRFVCRCPWCCQPESHDENWECDASPRKQSSSHPQASTCEGPEAVAVNLGSQASKAKLNRLAVSTVWPAAPTASPPSQVDKLWCRAAAHGR